MARDGYTHPTAFVHAELTYAVPVKVDVLGAYLEAHIATSPVIQTLQLCNRFAKGANAAINRLRSS